MPRPHYAVLAIALCGIARGEEDSPPPLKLDLGPVSIRPSGFFDWIGMYRSNSTGDSISTRFGRLPLRDSDSEFVESAGHSRGMAKATATFGDWKLAGYYEFDLLNTVGLEPFRTRQAWGEASIGGWSILAGKAWSLLRPNRHGLASDNGLMNTDVIEPAYHVGLVGARREQIRVTKEGTHWGGTVAFERRTEGTGGDFVVKVMHENGTLHLEAMGLAAGAGRRAFSVAAVVPVSKHLRFVTQEFIARHAANEALGIIPVGVSGGSFVQGIESILPKAVEVYGYGGLVYGARSSGNRLCRMWTVGASKRIRAPGGYGSFLPAVQFSQLDRESWRGGEGTLSYVQVQFRYNLW